jgi:hypothetical protein
MSSPMDKPQDCFGRRGSLYEGFISLYNVPELLLVVQRRQGPSVWSLRDCGLNDDAPPLRALPQTQHCVSSERQFECRVATAAGLQTRQ